MQSDTLTRPATTTEGAKEPRWRNQWMANVTGCWACSGTKPWCAHQLTAGQIWLECTPFPSRAAAEQDALGAVDLTYLGAFPA